MQSTRLLLTLLVIASLSSTACLGQSTGKTITYREQLWLAYFNQTRITDKFGFWLDVHYRRTEDFVDRPLQFIFRPGASYFIKDNLRASLGYAFVNHYPAAGMQTSRPEHRVWQQIWWNQKFPGLTLMQWLRLEERYVRQMSGDQLLDGYDFNYRLRYNVAFSIPLKGKDLVAGTPFIAVSNELFLNFGERIVYNTFDQNRFAAGIGYQFTPTFSAQLGYLNVFAQEASGNSYISSNAIRLFFYHSFDWRGTE